MRLFVAILGGAGQRWKWGWGWGTDPCLLMVMAEAGGRWSHVSASVVLVADQLTTSWQPVQTRSEADTRDQR